jgi:hypothetical protein
VLLITNRFRPMFTSKPLSTPAVGGDAATQQGMDSKSILFEAADEGDDALHTDDGSVERGAGNNDILVMSKGDNALPMDDDNGALRVDNNSPDHWRDKGTDNNLSASDVVAVISGSGAIGRRRQHPQCKR